MKYEELETRYNAIMKSPDTALTEAVSLLSDIKADYQSAEALAEKIATQENKIKELQDANIKLYLAQTGSAEPEPEDALDETDGETFVDNFFNELEKGE